MIYKKKLNIELNKQGIQGAQGEQGIQGAKGDKGDTGDSGKGIKTITEYYLATNSSSGVTTSTSGWTTTIQTVSSSKKYLWNYEKITYTDNSTLETSPVIIGNFAKDGVNGTNGKDGVNGTNGKDGVNGTNGKDGVSISSVVEYYLATSSGSGITTNTSGWTNTIQTMTATKKYLWNYEVINFSNSTKTTTSPAIIGVYGDKGEQGEQGIQGVKGEKGEQGIQGVKGDKGEQGIQGVKGDKGEKGDKGATGAQGQRGNLEFSGTEIDHIGTTEKAYTITTASNGIISSSMQILVGDTYVNTTSQDVWTCTTAGTPTTAKWKHTGRRKFDVDNTNIFRLFTPTTDYGSMQNTLSKQVVKGTNPFGEISDLLKITNTNGVAQSNYAPNNKAHKIDPKKTYRYVAYIKQEDANYTDYFGLQGYRTSGQYIGALSTGTAVKVAYFTSATNFGTLGRWYMVVGYVVANGTTTAPADSGVYDMVTKQKVRSVTNFQWLSTATAILQIGTLIRYTGSAGTKTGTAYLYDIRLDEIDGTEISLDNLLYGTTSQRGAIYKGALSTPPTTDIVTGDWYLSTTDNVIHWYNGSNWNNTITDYDDYRYKPAINDMINLAATNPNVPFLSVTNAWIKNLAAGNILANEIATQTLELKNDGVIKSDNYVEGESGFMIESDGNVEFNKGRFRGGFGKIVEPTSNFFDIKEKGVSRITIFRKNQYDYVGFLVLDVLTNYKTATYSGKKVETIEINGEYYSEKLKIVTQKETNSTGGTFSYPRIEMKDTMDRITVCIETLFYQNEIGD